MEKIILLFVGFSDFMGFYLLAREKHETHETHETHEKHENNKRTLMRLMGLIRTDKKIERG